MAKPFRRPLPGRTRRGREWRAARWRKPGWIHFAHWAFRHHGWPFRVTVGSPELTPELRAGRRALDGITGCQIVRDFDWLEGPGCWALHLRLQPPGLMPTEFVPASTDWFLLARQTYPDGSVGLYPAKETGLAHTFPHQDLNSPGPDEVLYREGKICTDTSARTLGRHDFDQEPRTPVERIRWHVLRAIDWLVAASKGELILPGEPFELPAYPHDDPRVLSFLEDRMSFAAWGTTSTRAGLAEPRARDLPAVRRANGPGARRRPALAVVSAAPSTMRTCP